MKISRSSIHPRGDRAPPMAIDSGGHRERFFERRDALVEAHMHLVVPIAHRIACRLPPSFDLEDLIATGYLALLDLATRYRPGLHGGAPFSAFARQRIRGAMLDSVRRKQWRENTCEPIDEAPEQSVDSSVELHAAFDDERAMKRLMRAIGALPDRGAGHKRGDTCAARLAELHEWRAAAGHVEAIAELRRRVKRTG